MNILIIDNDIKSNESLAELLRSFNYNPVSISSLVGQRPEDINAGRYDLAIVDIRMHDDDDITDISGLEFGVRLCTLGTPTVLRTGFTPRSDELFDLIWTGAVTGVVRKSLDQYHLAKSIEEFRTSHRFPNCFAKFSWRTEPREDFVQADWERVRKALDCPSSEAADFAVLFRSLLPPFAHTVELDPIAPGRGGTALFRARVSSGDGPVVEDVAIKYGTRPSIRSEAMRYDRHVGPLPDGVAAHLRWRKETTLLGAIAYSWVGDSIEDGIPFGPVSDKPQQLTWRRRRAAVERLFSVSLDPWHEVYRSESAKPTIPKPIVEYYTGTNGYYPTVPFSTGVLPNSLPSPVKKDGTYWDFGAPFGTFIDPAQWLSTGAGSMIELKRFSPSHGDLHVKNVFVLPDDSPRLIDFGDTALGHVFRDFAEIETSVRLTCCNSLDLLALREATSCIASQRNLGDHINHRQIGQGNSETRDLRETVRMVLQIRRAALDAVGGSHDTEVMREYLMAVALRMLRYADGRADEVSEDESELDKSTRVWHALYAAAASAHSADQLA